MKNIIIIFEKFLEKLDYYRNEFLFIFIKPFWPKNITPNHVTWSRIFIGLLLFVLLFFGVEDKALIVSLFCIGALTDFIDGPIARGLNKVTEFGAMLDSTADRILIIPIAIYSLFEHYKWLLLALILAEVLNIIVSIFYKSKEIYLDANIFGKTKMVMLSVVFAAVLIVWPAPPPTFFIYVLWVSLLFSFLSVFSRIVELNSKGFIENKIIRNQLNKYGSKK